MNKLYKWVLFNSLSASILTYYILFYDAVWWLYKSDLTKMTFVILLTYIVSSGYIAFGLIKNNISRKFLGHMTETMMGLGFLGTLIATWFLFRDARAAVDAKEAAQHIIDGMATANITTMFGIGSALLLNNQIYLVDGPDEKQ